VKKYIVEMKKLRKKPLSLKMVEIAICPKNDKFKAFDLLVK
jgi:hypothetical protein